jgi:hypothetical protein
MTAIANVPASVPGYTYDDGQVSLQYGSELHDIGWAYQELDEGRLVARIGWNGKGLFAFRVPGSEFEVNRAPLLGIFPAGTKIKYNSHDDLHADRNPVLRLRVGSRRSPRADRSVRVADVDV